MSFQDLTDQIGALQIEEAVETAVSLMDEGNDPSLIREAIMQGLIAVGEKYEQGKCFIADLMVSGMLAKDLFAIISPALEMNEGVVQGKVIIGTISGDIHDIGKNLISDALRMKGIEVIDLGVDVSVETFALAVEQHQPDIVSVSTSIDSTFAGVKGLVSIIREKHGDNLAIVVGGAIADKRFVELEGIDFMANDYKSGVEFEVDFLKKKQQRGA